MFLRDNQIIIEGRGEISSVLDFIFRIVNSVKGEQNSAGQKGMGNSSTTKRVKTAYRNYSDQSSGLMPLMGLQRH